MGEMIDEVIFDAATGAPIDDARMLLPGGTRQHVSVVEGMTIAELVKDVPADLKPLLHVFNHGQRINDWESFRTRAGDRILIAVVPGGGGGDGKSILGVVLMLALAIVAPYAAPALGVAAGTAAASAITIGVTMIGGMIISAMIAPPSESTADKSPGTGGSYTMTGQSNQPRPFQTCYVCYGQYKMSPTLASNANIDSFANSSNISALYDFGLGWVHIYDLRIGDVSIYEYSPALVYHTYSLIDNLQLIPEQIGYDQYAIELQRFQAITVRTKANSYAANLDLQAPKGIFQAAPKYGQIPWWCDFIAWWRPDGASEDSWQEVPIDWYHGAMGKTYTENQLGIRYRIIDFSDWTDYNPASSPNDMRALFAAWKAAQPQPNKAYNESIANGNLLFTYPGPAIDEGSYRGRYPEVWNPAGGNWDARTITGDRSARENFEVVGSRQGYDPGVPVNIFSFANGATLVYNTDMGLFGVPLALHNFDKQSLGRPQVGGWGWIESGGTLQDRPQQAPWEFQIVDPTMWNPAVYAARYPDVLPGEAWAHFTNYGAFEGRDPYVIFIPRSVRMIACWVGTYWLRIAFTFPTPGTYELRVMRTDVIEDGTDTSIIESSGGAVTGRFSETNISLLRSYIPGRPVIPRLRHTMLETRFLATDKLSGVVQNLSAVVISVLRIYDEAGNYYNAETRNPAWIAVDILTSEKNPKPLAVAQMDWPSWIRLAAICDTLRTYNINGVPYTRPRYVCDIVVDGLVTTKQLVESVLSGCRSSLVLTNAGTWGVLHDEEKTVPRQLITPANSWGFTGERSFVTYPHALRVNFIDNTNNGYVANEVIVYADGYSFANASIFETLDTFGITDYPHAWAYGRYMLAQGIQRSELFTLNMDVENLLVQRGDMVFVAHDVPLVGGIPARVIQVQDPPGQAVRIDQTLARAPTGYAIRMQDGTTRTGQCTPVEADGQQWYILDFLGGPQVDDLIVLGDYQRETFPYLVQRITPGPDLTAELVLCRYVAGVYDADIGALPPWDPGFGNDYLTGTDLVSQGLVVTQNLRYVDRYPWCDVQLDWITTGWALDHHEVTIVLPSGERHPLVTQREQNYLWTLSATEERRWFNQVLQFEVVAVNSNGYQGIPAYFSIMLLLDTEAPPPVQMFGVNVQRETIDLSWLSPIAPDVDYYILRYTPEQVFPDWNASQDLATFAWPASRGSASARTGSYGIRVMDTSGNISTVEWRRTTVASLPDLNVIERPNDARANPPWAGVRSHLEVVASELISEGEFGAVYPDGIYYGNNVGGLIDMGDIYEVRVTSKVEGYGVTAGDYMVMWDPLSDLKAMAQNLSSLWTVWAELRTADALTVMADWEELYPPPWVMAGAADDGWTEWRPVIGAGDFTGWLFEYRLIVRSRNPNVKAVVTSGLLEFDMPDRIDYYGDVPIPGGSEDLRFGGNLPGGVEFRSLQAVAITIDGSAKPLVAMVSDKQPIGFHLDLLDVTTGLPPPAAIPPNPEQTVDVHAQGYGRKGAASI